MEISPKVHDDERGSFSEAFNARSFKEATGLSIDFVQDSQIFSKRGVLRGMHLQTGEGAQYKLVRCLTGVVFDVAVDLRKESATYGKYVGRFLTGDNQVQLLVPPGVAHGVLALEDSSIVYKTDKYYDPKNSRSLLWCDLEIGICWPDAQYSLSMQDANAPRLEEYRRLACG